MNVIGWLLLSIVFDGDIAVALTSPAAVLKLYIEVCDAYPVESEPDRYHWIVLAVGNVFAGIVRLFTPAAA